MKDVQLDKVGPPGTSSGAASWRAASRLFQVFTGQFHATLADLTNTLLPSDCRLCTAPMLSLGSVRVCGRCLARMAPHATALAGKLCARCGDAMGMESARFAASMGVSDCTLCRMAPPEFHRAVAFATYDHQMRDLLHLLKFGKLQRVATETLATGLADTILTLQPAAANDLLVIPVPLFHARQRERGFNQAELLASAALQRLRHTTPGWKLQLATNILHRVKDTRALYRLNPRQRRANLRGAFRVPDATALRGREVLLIDDIMTTGATARECARVLRLAGATKVWVATASRAQPEGVHAAVQHQPADIALWTTHTTLPIEPDIGRQTSF